MERVRIQKPLNDRQIAALKPLQDKQYAVSNLGERGLSLLVSYGGTKVFYFRFTTHEGVQRRLKLGSYPDLSLAKAKELARKKRVMVDQGADPVRLKKDARLQAQIQSLRSVSDLWNDYRDNVGLAKKSAEFESSIWRTHIEPKFGRIEIEQFNRLAMLGYLNGVRRSKSPALSNRIWSDTQKVVRSLSYSRLHLWS